MSILEKILEDIDSAKDEYGMVDYVNDKPVIAKEQAKDIIRKHLSDNNGWIPVEEKRVPEKEVIAQNVYDEMMIGYVYYSEEMKWYECVSDDVYLTNVVAWQPLPEPYIKNPK